MNEQELVVLAREVRASAERSGSFRAIVDLIHERLDVPRYSRAPVAAVLRVAFGFELRDVADLVSCDLFGPDGTTATADAERLFTERLAALQR